MSAPQVHQMRDALIRIFDADPNEGDRSDMYVLDVFGVSINIYRRADGTKVHVDSGDMEERDRPLIYEINNGGDQVTG